MGSEMCIRDSVEVVGLPRSRHVATLDYDLPLLIDHGRSAVAAMTTH